MAGKIVHFLERAILLHQILDDHDDDGGGRESGLD